MLLAVVCVCKKVVRKSQTKVLFVVVPSHAKRMRNHFWNKKADATKWFFRVPLGEWFFVHTKSLVNNPFCTRKCKRKVWETRKIAYISCAKDFMQRKEQREALKQRLLLGVNSPSPFNQKTSSDHSKLE